MATQSKRGSILETAIKKAADEYDFNLTQQAMDAIISRAEGHIENRVFTEQARNNDVDEAVRNAKRFIQNLRAYKSDGTFTSVDFRKFVESSTNCFYPFCKPTK